MYVYFSNHKEEVESLSIKLVEELERCILSYFAFHWSHASLMINQVRFLNRGLLYARHCHTVFKRPFEVRFL
ncbi:putative calmodulin calcium-dependent NAD kinase NADKc [Helianthus annuus]|nr:putative calmodulin calcium-dependent NAD kinase NADKc [Helianthus annuus]